MKYLVSGSQMKEVDRYTIETIGIPSMVLMERAAYAVACEVLGHITTKDRIWAVCGTGNNGADGIAAARMLWLKGYSVSIILVGNKDHGTEEYQKQLSIAENLQMDIIESDDFIPGHCEVVIDAVFGVGLSREVGGSYRELLALLPGCGPRLVVAVDIPSGISADTGEVMGIALKADITVTFGYEKLGTVLYPGRDYSGRVIVADIGFPQNSYERTRAKFPELYTYGPEDLSAVPARPAYSNKGTFGKVLIVAGSKNMSGAAYLSAMAAYRTGAGLVKIFTVEENRVILQESLPEAIITTYDPEEAYELTPAFQELLEEQCGWASVIVLGPGIGNGPYTKNLVETVLANAYVPIILDADGLNTIARYPGLTSYFTENIIVTPHLGEMARLMDCTVENIRERLIPAAREYADRFGITCVLKDAVTVAALKDQRTYVNSSGNSAMAKAGSGDVLTGIIAGLLALGLEEADAAAMGVYLHGCAGDLVREEKGEHGLLAGEMAGAVSQVMKRSREEIK